MSKPANNPGTARAALWLFCFALAGVWLLPTNACAQDNVFQRLFSKQKQPQETSESKKTTGDEEPVPLEDEPKKKDDRNAFQVLRDRFTGKKNLPKAADGLVLRDGEMEREQHRDGPWLELDGAKKLYQDEKFHDALRVFHSLANTKKNPSSLIEEALFYEAESYYQMRNLREAKPYYVKLLKDFRHSGRFQQQATQRLFDIANLWLDDTRREIQQAEEKKVFVMPASFVNFTKTKPLFDVEGHALQALDEVRLSDLTGPLGEKALFYIATVKFYRQDFTNADYYFTELYEKFPNSPLAPKAVKQAIICKQMMPHGCVYDNRPIEEARKLVDTAARAFPEVNKGDDKFLERQLVAINQQQADRDYQIAEFYKRTGHPGSAYFYYELVRRRYPNTTLAEKATAQMTDIRSRAKNKQDEERAQPESVDVPEEPGRLRLPGGIINPVSWWQKKQ